MAIKIMQSTSQLGTPLFDWLGQSGLIPASAIIAIIIFVSREILEWRRKKGAKKNEIAALKKILARECELNWYLSNQISGICSLFEPYEKSGEICPLTLQFNKTPSSKTRYDISGDGGHGGVLPEVHTSIFNKYLFDVAKIDQSFYAKLAPAFEAAVELKHLRDSLIDIHDTAEWMKVNDMMVGFSGYALEEIKYINDNLKSLYKFCTKTELSRGRLR